MKKTAYYYLSLAAIVAGGLTSCQDEDLGYTKAEIVQSTYEKNFVSTYGEVAPGHMWGFNSSAITRAGSHNHVIQYRLVPKTSLDNVKGIYAQDEHYYDMEIQNGSDTWEVQSSDKVWAAANYQGPIQDAEKRAVNEYLLTKPSGALECPLDCYIVYNLGYLGYYCDTQANKTSAKYPNYGHMDELWFDNHHLNNYNGGSGEDYFCTNTRIVNPYYHNSQPSEYIQNHYLFITVPGWGNYLCFDYPADGHGGGYDGVYNDWVLKIAPGPIEMQKIKRVMCEDLGNTHDWDFNDVVYDYEQINAQVAKISIQAVCGTLPIYFTTDGENPLTLYKNINNGGNLPSGNDNMLVGDNAELHLVCGGTTTDEQIYYSNKHVVYVHCSNIQSLGILRQENSGMPWYKNPQEQEGRVPFLIACPVSTIPSPEDISIETTYSKWTQYVSNPSVEWWN